MADRELGPCRRISPLGCDQEGTGSNGSGARLCRRPGLRTDSDDCRTRSGGGRAASAVAAASRGRRQPCACCSSTISPGVVSPPRGDRCITAAPSRSRGATLPRPSSRRSTSNRRPTRCSLRLDRPPRLEATRRREIDRNSRRLDKGPDLHTTSGPAGRAPGGFPPPSSGRCRRRLHVRAAVNGSTTRRRHDPCDDTAELITSCRRRIALRERPSTVSVIGCTVPLAHAARPH